MTITNAFTVDVEDYYHVTAFENRIQRQHWNRYESRVVASTNRLLEMLDRNKTRGTFFILGWVAHQHPQLVRDIFRAGHEIGSHSYWHQLIYNQTPDEFRSDLRLSRDVLQDILGQAITLYRAPSFSITQRSLWALEILAEEGFKIDSSIFPTYHDRYGIRDAPTEIHLIPTNGGSIWEFPPAVLKTRLGNLPISGGGYFRLYPLWLINRCVKKMNRSGQPYMFYVHPWEVDPDQPKLPSHSRVKTWRHRVNLKTTFSKLDLLLKRFQFGTMSDVLSQFSSSGSSLSEQSKKAYIQTAS